MRLGKQARDDGGQDSENILGDVMEAIIGACFTERGFEAARDMVLGLWADTLQGKTGKRLMIGMSPTLEAVLERARAFIPHLPREYVLRRRDGKPYTQNGFRAIWQRTMRRHKAKGGQRFTFHDIRGKSATDSLTLNDAYERLGHTSIAMTRRVYDRGTRKVTPLR